MQTQLATAEERYQMVGTKCPNCGQPWNAHNESTGECPETPEYEPEEIAAMYMAMNMADEAIHRLETLMSLALTNRRMRRAEC